MNDFNISQINPPVSTPTDPSNPSIAALKASLLSPVLQELLSKVSERPRGPFTLERAKQGALILELKPDFDSPGEADYEIYLLDRAARPRQPTLAERKERAANPLTASNLLRDARDQGLGGVGAARSKVSRQALRSALANGPPYLPQLAIAQFPWVAGATIDQELIDIFPPYGSVRIQLAAPTPAQWQRASEFTLLVSSAAELGREAHPFRIKSAVVLNALKAGKPPAQQAFLSSPLAVQKACELEGKGLLALLESIAIGQAAPAIASASTPAVSKGPRGGL